MPKRTSTPPNPRTGELVEAWRVNQAMNLLLLDAIPASAMGDRYADTTRTVAAQFAHMHNNRIYHLKHRGPEFLGTLKAFPRGAQPTKTAVRKALVASAKAMARLFAHCEEQGKVKSWKNSPTTYLGYFIAHEAHHRGLTLVCLRVSGTKLPKDVANGLWYWRRPPDET